MPPAGAAYDTDWIFASGSNVHVATHRDWFTDIKPFKSQLEDGLEILGIGTVELPTKRSMSGSRKNTKRGKGKMILHDVLYAPGCVCNIIGHPVHEDYEIQTDFREGVESPVRYRKTGAQVAFFEMTRMFRLRLSGQTPNSSSLPSDRLYYISATWSNSERERWEATKGGVVVGSGSVESANKSDKPGLIVRTGIARVIRTVDEPDTTSPSSSASESPPYTQQEKKWLKENFRGEFHFLAAHGLSIRNEDDREEGRRLARAIMKADEEEEEVDKADSDTNSFLDELEENPMSHLADYHFSDEQLDWIKENFKHSFNFMMLYGLKPFDDEDCKEAVAIARGMMATGS